MVCEQALEEDRNEREGHASKQSRGVEIRNICLSTRFQASTHSCYLKELPGGTVLLRINLGDNATIQHDA